MSCEFEVLANIRFLISWVKCSSEEQQVLVSVAPQLAKNTPGSDFFRQPCKIMCKYLNSHNYQALKDKGFVTPCCNILLCIVQA